MLGMLDKPSDRSDPPRKEIAHKRLDKKFNRSLPKRMGRSMKNVKLIKIYLKQS